jgi:hypothetical protein
LKRVALKRPVRRRKTKARKPAESSSESDAEEVDLDDSDKDSDWGEETDDNAAAECLYCTGSFSYGHGQYWIRCIMRSKWAHTDCVDSEIEQLCVVCVKTRNKNYKVKGEQLILISYK